MTDVRVYSLWLRQTIRAEAPGNILPFADTPGSPYKPRTIVLNVHVNFLGSSYEDGTSQ